MSGLSKRLGALAILALLLPAPLRAQDAGAPPAEAEPEPEPAPEAEPEPEPEPAPEAEPEAEPAPEAAPEPEPEPEAQPSGPAWAMTPESGEPRSGEGSWSSGDRREAPDYSGRGEPPRDPADDILWIPRILFGPLYLISEYLFRQPIGWLATEIERTEFVDQVFDFFTWEQRNAGLVPTALFDFGFLPSVGLYFFWNDLGAEGHSLRVNAAFWGADWLHAQIQDRIAFDSQNELSLWVEGWRRPDRLWFGGGWDADERVRFGRARLGGGATYTHQPWRKSQIRYRVLAEANEFSNTTYSVWGDDESQVLPIEQAAAAGRLELPVGYTSGYFAFRHRLDLTLDTREERPAPAHGLRVQGWFEEGLDMRRAEDVHWLRYGARAAGFLDVGDQRVVQLSGYVDLVDPVGALDQVPFTEQIWLSREPLLLGGFLPGQLVGRSAAIVSLEYHWPIWVFIEGTIHYSVGNAFGGRFADFDVERLRQSFGIGFRTIGDRDNTFRLLVAIGTEPFVHGANVTSARLTVGSQSGF